jgi:hypothetical protein
MLAREQLSRGVVGIEWRADVADPSKMRDSTAVNSSLQGNESNFFMQVEVAEKHFFSGPTLCRY